MSDIDWGDDNDNEMDVANAELEEMKADKSIIETSALPLQQKPRPSNKWRESLELIKASIRVDADDAVSDDDEEMEQNCECSKRFSKATKTCYDAACINFATQVSFIKGMRSTVFSLHYRY